MLFGTGEVFRNVCGELVLPGIEENRTVELLQKFLSTTAAGKTNTSTLTRVVHLLPSLLNFQMLLEAFSQR